MGVCVVGSGGMGSCRYFAVGLSESHLGCVLQIAMLALVIVKLGVCFSLPSPQSIGWLFILYTGFEQSLCNSPVGKFLLNGERGE